MKTGTNMRFSFTFELKANKKVLKTIQNRCSAAPYLLDSENELSLGSESEKDFKKLFVRGNKQFLCGNDGQNFIRHKEMMALRPQVVARPTRYSNVHIIPASRVQERESGIQNDRFKITATHNSNLHNLLQKRGSTEFSAGKERSPGFINKKVSTCVSFENSREQMAMVESSHTKFGICLKQQEKDNIRWLTSINTMRGRQYFTSPSPNHQSPIHVGGLTKHLNQTCSLVKNHEFKKIEMGGNHQEQWFRPMCTLNPQMPKQIQNPKETLNMLFRSHDQLPQVPRSSKKIKQSQVPFSVLDVFKNTFLKDFDEDNEYVQQYLETLTEVLTRYSLKRDLKINKNNIICFLNLQIPLSQPDFETLNLSIRVRVLCLMFAKYVNRGDLAMICEDFEPGLDFIDLKTLYSTIYRLVYLVWPGSTLKKLKLFRNKLEFPRKIKI